MAGGRVRVRGNHYIIKFPVGRNMIQLMEKKKIEASFQLCFSLRRLESGWRAGYVAKRLPALTEGLQLGS